MRLVAIGLLLLVPMGALAHGGGLDRNGGHYNRKTGVYHCHREPCFSNGQRARQKPAPKADPPQKRPPEDGQERSGTAK